MEGNGHIAILPDEAKTMPFSLVALDTETTGLNVTTARIVEIGAVKLGPRGSSIEALHTRVNPGIPIPPEATRVHGISTADVRDCPTWNEVFPELDEMIWPMEGGLSPDALVGFNIDRFDLPIIKRECERARWAFPIPAPNPVVIDVLSLCVLLVDFRLDRSLGNVCRWLNVGQGPLHSAVADALRTVSVLGALIEKYRLPCHTAEELAGVIEAGRVNLDKHGRFVWRDGKCVIAFGKHFGVPLDRMVSTRRDYLVWMLEGDFDPLTKGIVRNALQGRLPSQEPREESR